MPTKRPARNMKIRGASMGGGKRIRFLVRSGDRFVGGFVAVSWSIRGRLVRQCEDVLEYGLLRFRRLDLVLDLRQLPLLLLHILVEPALAEALLPEVPTVRVVLLHPRLADVVPDEREVVPKLADQH